LAQGRQQIQEQYPAPPATASLAPWRRTVPQPQREQLLCRSRQLLHLIAEWEGLFPQKFFPRFATRSGFS